jgi:hypothetical protein
MIKWILYTIMLGWAAYWASNLLLWFSWSYSATLGITLMLTAAPVLWGYLIYLALKTYPQQRIMKGAFTIAVLLLTLSMVMDYIFFGLIRNAMEELYQPTTIYGYGFLLALPFVLALLWKERIRKKKGAATTSAIIRAGIGGLICFAAVVMIILLDITI